MQFGGMIATDAMMGQEDKRGKDLSKTTARFTRRDKDVAQECPECEGFGYHFNNDTSLGEHCSNCVKGWDMMETFGRYTPQIVSRFLQDSEDKETFNEGVKLGAGVAVGFSLVSLGIGLTAGVLGLIYERVTGE